MQVSIPLVNGYLPDRYGKYAPAEFKYQGTPNLSFPISISELPTDTVSIALVLVDYDAIPVAGFTWIHWAAANIPAHLTEIPEGASSNNSLTMIQGKNSNAGGLINSHDSQLSTRYTGPQPPDQDHTYTLYTFALDTKLPLTEGYWLNEFYQAIDGHVLAQQKTEFRSQK